MINQRHLFFTSALGFGGLLAAWRFQMLPFQTREDRQMSRDDAEFRDARVTSSTQISPTGHRVSLQLKSNRPLPRLQTFHYYLSEPRSSSFRPYTPISAKWDRRRGVVDLDFCVRIYPYPNGEVARHVTSLTSEQSIKVSGPHSSLDVGLSPMNQAEHVGMIAGGTGIAPMYQVLRILVDEVGVEAMPNVMLFYGNRSHDEVLLRQELEDLQKLAPHKIRIEFYVDTYPADQALEEWRGKIGYVKTHDIRENLPPPGTRSMILVSGPPAMMSAYCGIKPSDDDQGPLSGILQQMGYVSHEVFKF
eukprot:Partr_v1_DN28853_c1_g2_i2_m33266 putative May mediate the reduction of outer membrane cytochrome b5 (By similarity)